MRWQGCKEQCSRQREQEMERMRGKREQLRLEQPENRFSQVTKGEVKETGGFCAWGSHEEHNGVWVHLIHHGQECEWVLF